MANQLEVIVEIIFHATEDSRKIFQPISELFQIKEEDFSQERILGHYGNPILLVKARLVKKRAEEFVKKLALKISKPQMSEIIENMDMHFEDFSLFLRIGKKDLVRNQISIAQDNAVKIRIKMPIYKKDEIIEKYKELLNV
jgi:RNA binding exosome subunit